MAKKTRKDAELEKQYPSNSYLSLGFLDCDDKSGSKDLESAAAGWMQTQTRAKWPLAEGWIRNAAFYHGNHFSRFSRRSNTTATADGGGEFVVTPVAGLYQKYSQYISRDVDSKCKKAWEVPLGILTKTNPTPRGTPNSKSRSDRIGAKLSEIAFRALWEKPVNMPLKLRMVGSHLILFGTAALEMRYRDTDIPIKIPKYRLEEYDDAIQEELLGGEKPVRQVEDGHNVTYKRELCADVWSPFNIVVDPKASEDPNSLTWIAIRSYRDAGEVKAEYKRLMEDSDDSEEYFFSEAIDAIAASGPLKDDCLYWWEELRDILDSPDSLEAYVGTYTTSQRVVASNDAVVSVIDVKPNDTYTRGRTIVLVGDSLIYCGPARSWSEKYPERWHPYSIARWWSAPNRFWGIPLFSEVVPLQKIINKMDSLMKINQMFMAFGIWTYPVGSFSADDSVNMTPGIHMPFIPVGNGAGPQRVKNDPLPSEIVLQRQMAERAIDELCMVSRLMEGQNVSHLRSGNIIQMAQQERIENRAPVLMGFQEFIQSCAQNMLIEVNLNLEEDDPELTARMRAAAFDYSGSDLQRFTAADLRDNVSISIDIISALLTSPEAESQKALDYLTARQGNVTPGEMKHIQDKMGWGDFGDPMSTQVERAESMLEDITGGSPERAVPDPSLDDPGLFLQIFQDAKREGKFYEYPDEARAKIDECIQIYSIEHQKMIQAQMQQQLDMQKMGMSPAQ